MVGVRAALGAALLAAVSAAGGEAGTLAVTGATVHPVSSAPIEDGVVLVEDGTIVAVGSDVEIPADAERVDLGGLHLYPGFVHPHSRLGLVEISSVRGTRDDEEVGELNSDLRAEVAFHADSELLPVAMSGGVLTALVVPQGGVFRGTSALMRLDGWNWEDMTLEAPVGMHLTFPTVLAPDDGDDSDAAAFEKKKKEALELLDTTLDDAEAYGRALDAAAAAATPPPDRDDKLEALLPVLAGELPLFVHAEEKNQIEGALDWAAERGIGRLVLVAGEDVGYLAERVAEAGIPVILDGVLEVNPRPWEPYDRIYEVARILDDAGVSFAIGDGGGGFDAAHVRNLPFHAARAAAHGLARDAALRAVTLAPAQILGAGDRLGSLEAGKEATFMATTGDPLEVRTRVERVWVAGREVDLETRDRQKRLYRRYDARPRPAGSAAGER